MNIEVMSTDSLSASWADNSVSKWIDEGGCVCSSEQ
jgi:hypothetical protein